MKDPETQLELFRQATAALGGQHATARYMGLGERTLRYLLAGDRPLHDGHLRDIGRALIDHADRCKQLERQISPAFASNLTALQRANQGKPDRRRFDQRES